MNSILNPQTDGAEQATGDSKEIPLQLDAANHDSAVTEGRDSIVTEEMQKTAESAQMVHSDLSATVAAGVLMNLPPSAPEVVASLPPSAPEVVASLPPSAPEVVASLPPSAPEVVASLLPSAPEVVASLPPSAPALIDLHVDTGMGNKEMGVAREYEVMYPTLETPLEGT